MIPSVTRSLLLINILVYVAQWLFESSGVSLVEYGGLHFFLASHFQLWQFATYMFMHGGFAHLFFNMFALWMFGSVIERTWGPQKFLFYYIACGIGAGLCQELVQFGEFYFTVQQQFPGSSLSETMTILGNSNLNGALTIGASGAVYAILLAFGMTFPNERIFIFPIPVPIKAKWLICGYVAFELFMAMSSIGDGIAHMAHVGGMLFGFLLISYWRRHPERNFDISSGRQFFEKWNRSRKTSNTIDTERYGETGYNVATGNGPRREDDMEYNARKKALQDEIDALLDKIRISGYDSLTKEERKRLFEASREK